MSETAAASFVAEPGESVSALQKCIMVVSQTADTERFELDIPGRTRIHTAPQTALAELRQTARRLIVENARTRLP